MLAPPLVTAAQSHVWQVARRLIEAHGVRVDGRDEESLTPLMHALMSPNGSDAIEMIALLSSHGADLCECHVALPTEGSNLRLLLQLPLPCSCRCFAAC